MTTHRLGPSPHTTRDAFSPDHAHGAGNIDCKELVAGSTLFVPVTVPGALLYLGDGHAAQGDGEAGGTAIECSPPMRYLLSGSRTTSVDVN